MRRYLLPRFSQTALSGDKARVYGDLMRLGGDEIAQLTVEGVPGTAHPATARG